MVETLMKVCDKLDFPTVQILSIFPNNRNPSLAAHATIDFFDGSPGFSVVNNDERQSSGPGRVRKVNSEVFNFFVKYHSDCYWKIMVKANPNCISGSSQ